MTFEIRDYLNYDAQQIVSLYASVGWSNYTKRPAMLRRAYENSLCILGAYDGDRLIGVVRAVGDGVSVVFVQDLLVLPEYQRQGVGRALMRALTERYASVYQLELLTDDTQRTEAFYRAVGLVPADALGCRAFLRIRN